MRKITQIQSALSLFLGITLLVPVVSIAQAQVSIDEADLNSVATEKCQPGNYQRVGPVRKGYLASKSKIEQPYNLTQGRSYCFVVVGDEQALDTDLEILNRQGKRFKPRAQDRSNEEIAYVIFPAKQRGQHQAQVEMFTCQAEQCEYALATYRKR
ncbi:MAG: hypothetical protein CLLPBCKN_000940 [Chroococcidiopsis cubana SAG 39.79]|uniref:Uncharacterized protein n=1 Tax=Chroococcidiopsis cubana SAG 39.79 TaxID=388085 RepID=A0AB37UCG3_9CYAN|nr:hypothetical protein [Chroococcidiopsis cubana]MDZ4871552.1 hypothetical protein [Chroococcidiopsis cubana SAG 39.79]PSB61753.1 hypothetical protein C7B79_20770 [Chroococcidiopsis cubana CCALA 043]RUT05831.1 hypothetical protein DSM107010_54190 [Chroococcidiopsis cubana SAG 39.79]